MPGLPTKPPHRTLRRFAKVSSNSRFRINNQKTHAARPLHSVQQAAAGTGQVSRSIDGVRHAAERTGGASAQLLTAANGLTQQADALRVQVDRFLAGIRG